MDLKQSIAIPGTKIKIPMIEAIAAGAAVIAAYVLIKGQSSQSADVSTPAADTTSAGTTSADETSVLTGQLETMSQELAAIEAAMQSGSAASTPGGGAASIIGYGTAATVPDNIPVSDLTSPAAVEEIITNTINPKAIITPGAGPNQFTISMPASKPVSVSPAPQWVKPKTNTTAPATASNNPSHANLATRVAPNPVPAAQSAHAKTSTTTINPKSFGSVRKSKANAVTLAGSK